MAKENLPSKVFIGECELSATVRSFGPKKFIRKRFALTCQGVILSVPRTQNPRPR